MNILNIEGLQGGPSLADIVRVNSPSQERARNSRFEQTLGLGHWEPDIRGHIAGWKLKAIGTLAGAVTLLQVIACSPARTGDNPNLNIQKQEGKQPPTPTLGAGGSGGAEPLPTVPANYPDAKRFNETIGKINRGEKVDDNQAVNDAQKALKDSGVVRPAGTSTPEAEQQAQCSFSKDPKFCGLAEVYKGNNPKTGEFKSVGIRAPKDPETVIEIVSPIDGWIQPILDNSHRADISTNKVGIVEGWVIDGVEFNPTESAEATPIKKGQVIGTLKDTGYRPLSYAPDYIAYFGPRSSNINAHIAENFPAAAGKPIKDVEFKSSGTRIEQGPVIIGGG